MLTHFATPSLAFLGPLGGPEIIMILLVLFFLVAPAVLAVFLILLFNKKKAATLSIPPALPGGPPSTQARLQELDVLKSQNLISESEYEEKRKQILGGL